MMIALNLFYFEIYTIYKEDMINQLDQGKTGCGKIAADIHGSINYGKSSRY